MNCLSGFCVSCETIVKNEIEVVVKEYAGKLMDEVEAIVKAQTSNIVADFTRKLNEATIVSASNVSPIEVSFTFPASQQPIVPR